jgi:hypothetical protein
MEILWIDFKLHECSIMHIPLLFLLIDKVEECRGIMDKVGCARWLIMKWIGRKKNIEQ